MKDLQQIQEQAIHSDQEKDLFLYHMTHGFGSPLHIIKNRSDAVYQDDRSSDDVREMTLEILEAGQKLEDMIALMMDQSDEEVRNGLQETEYDTCTSVTRVPRPQRSTVWSPGSRRAIKIWLWRSITFPISCAAVCCCR